MENLGHMPRSLTDVCLTNFIVLLFEVRPEIWECLVASPQYCDQDIPSCHLLIPQPPPLLPSSCISLSCVPTPLLCSKMHRKYRTEDFTCFGSSKKICHDYFGSPERLFSVVGVLVFSSVISGVCGCFIGLIKWMLRILELARPVGSGGSSTHTVV